MIKYNKGNNNNFIVNVRKYTYSFYIFILKIDKILWRLFSKFVCPSFSPLPSVGVVRQWR